MKIRKYLFVFILLIFTKLSYAAIYQWQDDRGVMHYSDQAVDNNAKAVILDKPMIAKSVVPLENSQKAKTAEQKSYTLLQIEQPQDQSTIWNAQGNVTISLKMMPALQKQDKLQILLDGKAIKQITSLSTELTGITRGAHQLQSQIIAPDNRVLLSSKAVIFYLQQPHVKKT